MSRIAEARERHEHDVREGRIANLSAQGDRAYLLDLVARMRPFVMAYRRPGDYDPDLDALLEETR